MNTTDFLEIEDKTAFENRKWDLAGTVSQGLNLLGVSLSEWQQAKLENAYFLGCQFDEGVECYLGSRGAVVFPRAAGTLYNPYRSTLYTQSELRSGYKSSTDLSLDQRIYCRYQSTRDNPNIIEALMRRIHDHAIDDALDEYLKLKRGTCPSGVVGIMGGASKGRNDPFYKKVAHLTHALTSLGYLVVSGGGPGMMEAANLGAFYARKSLPELDSAIQELAQFPLYAGEKDKYTVFQYLDVAYGLSMGEGCESLALPTWFYGHEPTNAFATHIAKYFANSIREEGLLALCRDGVVFAPGSAGTTQEIFMNAAQNHYATFGSRAPMVFFGKQRYHEETSLYRLTVELASDAVKPFLGLCQEPEEVVSFLTSHRRTSVDPAKAIIDCSKFAEA